MDKKEAEDIKELEEEFVTLDDDEIDELFEDVPIADTDNLQTQKKDKKLLMLISILLIALVVVSSTIYYLYTKKRQELQDLNQTRELIHDIESASSKKIDEDQNLTYEQRVSKDIKILLKEGKKSDALDLREELAIFNNALSHYNLGVAKLKAKDYEDAKKEFLNSLKSPRIKFESILNLAIISYYQKDKKSFIKYLQLSKRLLPSKRRSPLYSYYRFLIDYYGGFFAESLVPLHNQSSSYYQKEKNHLIIKLSTLVHNFNEAILTAQKSDDPKYNFPLGILHAKIGDFEVASKYLNQSIKDGYFRLQSQIALSLVDIKTGMFEKSSKLLKKANDTNESKASNLYKIVVVLKESLFDPLWAQKEFQNRIFLDELTRISLLLYFAPYKIDKPQLSSSNLQKGVKNIFINNFKPALSALSNSKELSSANFLAIKAIKESLNGSLIKAKEIFKEAIKSYPNSSELHYDLGLTYAKMYQFQKALKEFSKSAVLDRNNLLSQTFAYFCKRALHQEGKDELQKLRDRFLKSNKSEYDINRALALLSVSSSTFDESKFKLKESIFDKVILLSTSSLMGKNQEYKNLAKQIKKDAPDDIVAEILELDASMHNKDIKRYAKQIQERLIVKRLKSGEFGSNATLPRELFTRMLSIAGIVYQFRDSVKKELESDPQNIGLLQTLAYSDIYLKNFDEAYKIYNHLIDDLKQDDSHTLLLGAIASIGAKHHANAIALLELSKLQNRTNFESRVALGLLYLENKNLEGASIEFKKIGDIGFKSQYFDFYIKDHQKN